MPETRMKLEQRGTICYTCLPNPSSFCQPGGIGVIINTGVMGVCG